MSVPVPEWTSEQSTSLNVFSIFSFFLDPASLGHSRAKCAAQLLQELNPDVNGDYLSDPIETVLERNPDFLANFAAVVATNIKESLLIQLSMQLWDLGTPFVFCRSIGFFGTARLQLKEHCIVETHPDNKPNDLRIDRPFDQLRQHLEQSSLGLKVPWPVVLYKFLKQWSVANGGRMPTTYKEKCELRKMISGAMTKDEENYEEAIRAVNTSFGGGRPSADLLALLGDGSCMELCKDSKRFWILTRAVRDFCAKGAEDEAVDGSAAPNPDGGSGKPQEGNVTEKNGNDDAAKASPNGMLPLSGVIPDMTSSTANFINLQNVFRAKALADAELVYANVQHHLAVLGLPVEHIGLSETQQFCREVATLGIVRGTRICDEYAGGCPELPNLTEQLDAPDSLAGHYVALRAMDRFRSEHGCDPGEVHVEADTAKLKAIAGKLLTEWGVGQALNDDLAHEVCRCGGAEVHSVSAFLGEWFLLMWGWGYSNLIGFRWILF